MEFQQLGVEERKMFFKLLDIDTNNLKCEYCNDNTTYDKCCILPPLNDDKKILILCESILCLSQYLTNLEEWKEKQKITCINCGHKFLPEKKEEQITVECNCDECNKENSEIISEVKTDESKRD